MPAPHMSLSTQFLSGVQVLLELSLPGSSSKLVASGWEVLACGPELEPEMIITPYCPCQAVLLSHLPIKLPRTKEEGY